jgi:hypothetical protein
MLFLRPREELALCLYGGIQMQTGRRHLLVNWVSAVTEIDAGNCRLGTDLFGYSFGFYSRNNRSANAKCGSEYQQ